MNKYRILLYRKNVENPIVLSVNSHDNKNTLLTKLEKIFQSPKISQINCDSSTFIGRPSQIDGIELFLESGDNTEEVIDNDKTNDENGAELPENESLDLEKEEELDSKHLGYLKNIQSELIEECSPEKPIEIELKYAHFDCVDVKSEENKSNDDDD